MTGVKSPFGFKSIVELVAYFKDEQNCLDYLEESKWGGTICCDKCGSTEKIYRFSDKVRYKCSECRHQFTAKTGTIFQDSKTPMIKWIMAMYLLGTMKKGISTRQLAEQINVTQKTAWFLTHRIREAFTDTDDKLTKYVEIDETFVGGKNKNRHMDKRIAISKDRTYPDKVPVVGIVAPMGKLRCIVAPNVKRETLTKIVFDNVEKGAIVVTDEWQGYNGITQDYFHEVVDHGKREFINDCGFGTNRIEGFWTHLKKSIFGIYHRVSRKHLHRFVKESVFRYNFRGVAQHLKLHAMMQNIRRPLPYKKLIADVAV